MKLPIYLDYMATTPVDPRVTECMIDCLTEHKYQGNPSSHTHQYGWLAEEVVEKARMQVANLIGADAHEIFWTSGGTESDNLAIKGVARFYQRQGNHIITCATEHKAVLDTCKSLVREGFDITFLTPKVNGLIDLDELTDNIRPTTLLVSIMHANNEIGVIQDIQSIAEITRERGVLCHVDAAQSVGKLPINLKKMPVDLMSFSAHKIYGPKGMGALFMRSKPKIRLDPLFHGGGHEKGIRSGTLPVHQIVGMGKAFEIAAKEINIDHQHILTLRNQLWERLCTLGNIDLNGDLHQRLAGNLNFSIQGVDATALLQSLTDLALSTGSACSSGQAGNSHVLRAIHLDESRIRSSVRLSLGRFSTQDEVNYVEQRFLEEVPKLRKS